MSDREHAASPETCAPRDPSRTRAAERLDAQASRTCRAGVRRAAGGNGAGAVAAGNALAEGRLERVRGDFDMLAKAMNGYGIDRCGGYMPPDTSERRKANPSIPLTFECQVGYMEKMPVGRDHRPREFWCPLTTPIAYAARNSPRPLRNNGPYGYTCWNYHDDFVPVGVIHSPGPNGRADWPLETIREDFERVFRASGTEIAGGSPAQAAVIRRMVQVHLYDPTNGTASGGDLVAVLSSYGPTGWITPSSEPQRTGTNETEIPTMLADPATSGSIAPGWKIDDPLPPAPHAEAYISRERGVKLPFALFNFINSADLRASDTTMHLALARLDPQRGRLGRDFAGFFAHPHLLDRAEELSLVGWQATQPGWWSAMERMANSPDLHFNYSVSAAELYTLLPLYGKSQLLLAAYDATTGAKGRALERVSHLQGTLDGLRKENPDPGGPL